VIGVYEPMILVRDGHARETSRAAEGDDSLQLGACYHRACFTQELGEPRAETA
jgi:hypothetical protein